MLVPEFFGTVHPLMVNALMHDIVGTDRHGTLVRLLIGVLKIYKAVLNSSSTTTRCCSVMKSQLYFTILHSI